MSTIQIRVLGSFEISHPEGQSLRRKERALLAYLAVQTRPIPRHTLIHRFYTGAEDPAAALRLSLSRLRRALGVDILQTPARAVQWNPRAGWVDYAEFSPLLTGDLAARSADVLASALILYRGEFLSGLALEDAPEAELWILQERTHLHALYERGALELIRRWSLAGQWEAAIRQTRSLLTHSPLLEPAHERLIELYRQTGQTEAAYTHYEQFRQRLEREMGLAPSPELQQRVVELKTNRTNLHASARPEDAPFAGREAELRELHTHWQAAQTGRSGVVLIEGEAGGGKSTLVTYFARQFAIPTLTGNCYETTHHLPYTPWIE